MTKTLVETKEQPKPTEETEQQQEWRLLKLHTEILKIQRKAEHIETQLASVDVQ